MRWSARCHILLLRKNVGGIIRSRDPEFASAPVSIASGFPDRGSGVPWLVDGAGWEGVPVSSVVSWEGSPADSDWEEVPIEQAYLFSLARSFFFERGDGPLGGAEGGGPTTTGVAFCDGCEAVVGTDAEEYQLLIIQGAPVTTPENARK